MNPIYDPNIDHEYYARIGRQMQAREAFNLFAGLKSQIKKTFSGNVQKNAKTPGDTR